MDALADRGIIVAGGPLGGENDAARVLHVVNAPAEVKEGAVEAMMPDDPWTSMRLLRTVSIEPWSVLLGGFDCIACGSVLHAPKK
ncbi:MAG: YciI family protein [Candidatus Tyrphobacter sp.]